MEGPPQARIIECAGTPPLTTGTRRRPSMKWETPEAIDMRFGMEITMYIANR
jgi:coenzyme PQQ precursor peptide PqqA